MNNQIKDLESIYDKVITPYIKTGKGSFYLIEIQPKRLQQYMDFLNKNCTNVKIIRVKEEVNESSHFGEVFSIVIFTDMDMESIANRRWVYTFRLIFWRHLKTYSQVAKWVLTPVQYVNMLIAIGDTKTKSKFSFITKIRNKIFVSLNSKVIAYDIKSGKAREYWGSKQNSLFENNPVDIEDIIFFEKFIYKSLDL